MLFRLLAVGRSLRWMRMMWEEERRKRPVANGRANVQPCDAAWRQDLPQEDALIPLRTITTLHVRGNT